MPDAEGYQKLIEAGFKTIIYLNDLAKFEVEYLEPFVNDQEEAAETMPNGFSLNLENIRFHWIPLDGHTPDLQKFKRVLRIVLNPNNQPVLIHCKAGKHRTGMITMALRKIAGGQWLHPSRYSLGTDNLLYPLNDGAYEANNLMELEYYSYFTNRGFFSKGPRDKNIAFINSLDVKEFQASADTMTLLNTSELSNMPTFRSSGNALIQGLGFFAR